MEEKRTAFGRTPTDKAWQELKRHREQMQGDSTRIINEIGQLEREVETLRLRLEEERLLRAAQRQTAVDVQGRSVDHQVAQPSLSEEINITGQDGDLKLDQHVDESEAFDTFFAVDDSELDKERRFLLD